MRKSEGKGFKEKKKKEERRKKIEVSIWNKKNDPLISKAKSYRRRHHSSTQKTFTVRFPVLQKLLYSIVTKSEDSTFSGSLLKSLFLNFPSTIPRNFYHLGGGVPSLKEEDFNEGFREIDYKLIKSWLALLSNIFFSFLLLSSLGLINSIFVKYLLYLLHP